MLIKSMDDDSMIHSQMQQLMCRGNDHKPNKDVTLLLLNPEQALKKNLKPIKTSYSK